MPKLVIGGLAVIALAGWAGAIIYFSKSGDFESKLAASEAERGKLADALDSAERNLSEHVETAGRLDEISQKLSVAEDRLAALDSQVQAKQDEVTAAQNAIETGKVELAKLESQIDDRRASISKTEQEIEMAGFELESLRAEAEELKQKAALAPSESLTEPVEGLGTASEVASAEAEPKETDRMAEARRRFEIVDENVDGRMDQFEFRLKSVRIHDYLDANRDGFVTIDETLLSSEKFQLFDTDGDGKISPIEFARSFPALDTAGQGFITFDDYLGFIEATAK